MKFSSLLDPRLIHLRSDAQTIEQAVEIGLRSIVGLYAHELDYEDALSRIRERQRLGGTIFPTGVAIPHARFPNLNDFIAAVVVPRHPIPEAIPVRLVWIMIHSQSESTIYLNSLARIVECSKDEAAMAALIASESPEAFIEEIDARGYEVRKSLCVGDIMEKELLTVRETSTLKELMDAAYERKRRFVPVVDATGALVGEVGVLDIIRVGIPDYAFRIGSLKFLAELEPLSELLQNEDKILVKSIMQKPEPIPANTSVVEAAFEMAKSKKRDFTVVENGRVVGVLSCMDIFTKVLRA